MKSDINDRNDLILLVNTFYKKVEENSTIGPIFTEVAKVDWSKHLPKMYDFWESVLFGKAIYKGNPMLPHLDLKYKTKMEMEQFDTWKSIFFKTVDDLFEGENADMIKMKAKSIADLMHFKLSSIR